MLRVARLAGVGMDELLAGQWLSPRVCPHFTAGLAPTFWPDAPLTLVQP